MKGPFFLVLVGVFLLSIAATLQAAPIEIKFAHVNPAEVFASGKSAAGAVLKNLIEADSSGGVEVKVFPASQLGGRAGIDRGYKDWHHSDEHGLCCHCRILQRSSGVRYSLSLFFCSYCLEGDGWLVWERDGRGLSEEDRNESARLGRDGVQKLHEL